MPDRGQNEAWVTDAMVDAALNAEYGSTSVHDLGDPYFKSIYRDIMRAALEAALTIGAEDEHTPRGQGES